MTDPMLRVREWIEGDPDPSTREELESLIVAEDHASLDERFDGELAFGTAGIRGKVGAGPNRMNRAVVIRTTAGLARYLDTAGLPVSAPVVVGFDARPTSRQFAEDAAGVLAAAGRPVIFFPEYSPTPLVAFAVIQAGAAAGVVVTASHNPPADNGYKVYASNGAQIIPPVDTLISEAIAASPQAVEVARVENVFQGTSPLVTTVPDGIVDDYWARVDETRPRPAKSAMKIVYTPIHGVGGRLLTTVFERAGYTGLTAVEEQSAPDGRFPTVAFPNPEEPGALDLAIETATDVEADLIIANDPDADRLAAVVRDGDRWRPLSGNEIGVLLGDHVLANWKGSDRAIVVNSIVSSPMLGRLASRYGARHEVTLTGFKWIVNAGLSLEAEGEGRFAYGYEEALGYTVGTTVRDKDGISAALVFCDLVSGLRGQGKSPLDHLADLWTTTGVWASVQRSLTRPGPGGQEWIAGAVAGLADDPPSNVAGNPVVDAVDYRAGAEERPPWLGSQDLVELSLGDRGRVLVRPSGTEPKLKVYADMTEPVGDHPLLQQSQLTEKADDLTQSLMSGLGD